MDSRGSSLHVIVMQVIHGLFINVWKHLHHLLFDYESGGFWRAVNENYLYRQKSRSGAQQVMSLVSNFNKPGKNVQFCHP
jgi:hypothetical protein